MRLLRDDIGRLARRPATWLTLLLVAGFLALVFIVIGATVRSMPDVRGTRTMLAMLTFPAAYDAILAFLTGLGALLALVYGAAVAGSEWTWGTLKNAVARGESRAGYSVTLFGAVAAVLAVGVLLLVAAGVVVAVIGASLAGISTAGLSDSAAVGGLPEKVVRVWVAMVQSAAIGYAAANITRSQLAGIATGVVTYLGEQFSGILFPDVVKYLPFHAAEAASSIVPPSADGPVPLVNAAYLPPDTALVVTVLWVAAALILSAVVTQRADITG